MVTLGLSRNRKSLQNNAGQTICFALVFGFIGSICINMHSPARVCWGLKYTVVSIFKAFRPALSMFRPA